MRTFLVVIGGFLIGSAMAVGVALIPTTAGATRSAASGQRATGTAMPTAMTSPAPRPATANAHAVKLTIQHVQRGCHVWSTGTTTGTSMRLHLKTGQTLSITNMDVDDAHQMMQLGGPIQLHLGPPMMMNRSTALTFSKSGTYRFGTKLVEMAGTMKYPTIGPDNKLRLVVTVA